MASTSCSIILTTELSLYFACQFFENGQHALHLPCSKSLQRLAHRWYFNVAMTAKERRRQVCLMPEFLDKVIAKLKNLWPDCRMVSGSPRHSESNGGVKRVNWTVQAKLSNWMRTNESRRWSIGCRIIQWRYNTQVHSTVGDTPYHLLYGQNPHVGITELSHHERTDGNACNGGRIK